MLRWPSQQNRDELVDEAQNEKIDKQRLAEKVEQCFKQNDKLIDDLTQSYV